MIVPMSKSHIPSTMIANLNGVEAQAWLAHLLACVADVSIRRLISCFGLTGNRLIELLGGIVCGPDDGLRPNIVALLRPRRRSHPVRYRDTKGCRRCREVTDRWIYRGASRKMSG